MKNSLLLIFLFLGFNTVLFSQNIINKQVTIPEDDYMTSEILKMMEIQSGARFSYNSDLFNPSDNKHFVAENETIEFCLNNIFDNKLRYQVSGKYIVLLPKPQTPDKEADKQKIIVKGQIKDENNQPLANVSVYDLNNQYSTTTNQNGEFYYTVNTTDPINSLSIAKDGFTDTVILCSPRICSNISVSLNQQDSILKDLQPYYQKQQTVENYKFIDFIIPKINRINSINLAHIKDTTSFQISFLPGISSNLSKQGVLYNRMSFNILIGYTKGVKGFELAGLMNIDKENVTGLQISGLSNFVGGSVKGLQTAGISNVVLKQSNAVQFAGITNFVKDDFTGFQCSGVINSVIGDFTGVQGAGAINFIRQNCNGAQFAGFGNFVIRDFRGIQIAGAVNFSNKTFEGTQVAGFTNIVSNKFQGAQVSGFANVSADTVEGVQVTGFLNTAKTSDVQISGFLNLTSQNNGIQIAPFNYADTSNGISIGVLCIVRKGLHKLIVSSNELEYINLTLQTGTNKFYNIFSLGYQPSEYIIWGMGYGFGKKLKLAKNLNLNFELLFKTLNYNTIWNEKSFTYTSFSNIFEIRFFKRVSLYLGPSFNFYAGEKTLNTETLDYISKSYNYSVFDNQSNVVRTKGWIGFFAGISL